MFRIPQSGERELTFGEKQLNLPGVSGAKKNDTLMKNRVEINEGKFKMSLHVCILPA